MTRGPWILLVVMFQAVTCLAADDNLQSAKEQAAMNRWGDVFHYVKLELQSNPRSWRAYRLLGDYHLLGLKQPKDAIAAYLKAYRLGVGRQFSSSAEHKDYVELCKDFTTVVQDSLMNASEAGGTKLLEQIVVDKGFASLPLAYRLMGYHAGRSNWAGVQRVVESLKNVPEFYQYRSSDRDLGAMAYYQGQASEAQGDLKTAYTQYLNAQARAATEIGDEAKTRLQRLQGKLEESVSGLLDQAKKLFEQRNYAKARELYDKAVSMLPTAGDLTVTDTAKNGVKNCEAGSVIEAAAIAVRTARKNGDYGGALEHIRKLASVSPHDPQLRQRLNELAAQDEQINAQMTAQQEQRDRAAQANRETRTKLILDAQELRKQGNFQKAGEMLQKALRMEKTEEVERLYKEVTRQYDIQDQFEQGKQAFEKNNYTGALKALEFVTQEDSEYKSTEVKKHIALCCFELHQFEKAIFLAEEVLKHQEDPTILERLVRHYEQNRDSRGATAEALKYLKRLERLKPDDAELSAKIAALSWDLNKHKYIGIGTLVVIWLATWIFLKKRPEWSKRINLADLERFMNKKDYRSAADLYQKVVKMALSEKEELVARGYFARAFYEVREYSKAISECQQVLRLLPENKQTRVLLARCLYATKNISPETLPLYLDFIETEPQNREVIAFVGGFCAKKQIINPTTLNLLRTLANLTPDDDKLRALLVKGYLKDNDRSQNALVLYEVEKKKNPKNIDVRVVLAEEYLRKGDPAKAIQECEEILNVSLNEARTHKVLADAYAKLGKTPELMQFYQSILEEDPHNGAIQGFLSRLLGNPSSSGVAKRQASPDQQKAMLEQAGEQASAEQAPQESGRGKMACPRCGKQVVVGTYFCSCGQPL